MASLEDNLSGLSLEENAEAPKPRFIAPKLFENPTGWGPTDIPEQFRNLPYQPFSKGDKIGKIADWTGTLYNTDRKYGRTMNQYAPGSGNVQLGSQYTYFHEGDDSSFQLVDSSRTQRPGMQRVNRMRQIQMQKRLQAQKERERRIQASMGGGGKGQRNREKDRQKAMKRLVKQFGQRQKFDPKQQVQIKQRQPSVPIGADWEVVEEMDFPRLSKLHLPNVDEGEDISCYGSLEPYDRTYDRVTPKHERPLQRISRLYFNVTTTDDPVIQKLSKNPDYHVRFFFSDFYYGLPDTFDGGILQVFATDQILSTIMCATRSVYSWDIVVHRVGNKLFFDHRSDAGFDLLTVSETAKEPPQDDEKSMNSPKHLALEATYINSNFSQQVLKLREEGYKFDNPNPFIEDDMNPNDVASVGYRYRRWSLGNGVNLVCRTQHDGVMIGPNGEPQFLTIKAFNEWDSRFSGGVDWRTKLEVQRGAVLAAELRNNSNKLAKWTTQALLAGSDFIKFGYVSRVHTKDSTKHEILAVQQFKPAELASQINLGMENAWGKYLLLKDPNKTFLRLYKVPMSAFEDEDDDDVD